MRLYTASIDHLCLNKSNAIVYALSPASIYMRPIDRYNTWGRFWLICWQNKVGPHDRKPIYIKFRIGRDAVLAQQQSRELSGSIKSLAISQRYTAVPFYCVTCEGTDKPPTFPRTSPPYTYTRARTRVCIYIYISDAS